MEFAPGVRWRASKRGLVVASPAGETLLLEHASAADLPALLDGNPSRDQVSAHLAPDGDRLVDGLLEAGVLSRDLPSESAPARERRVVLSRSGIEFSGIDRHAAAVHRLVMPLLGTRVVQGLLVLFVLCGAVALAAGPPGGPRVSPTPVREALLGLLLGFVLTFAHEFAHAVALVHYGRRPGRAGVGFYWGSLSFFVDSTDALTLPRRQRVVQALAGIAMDLVSVAALALVAHASDTVLLTVVAWRLALMGCMAVMINSAPVLQVDGHWALADLLDEPDLAQRSRAALGARLRGRRSAPGDGWLPVYGAVSLASGIALLALAAVLFWHAAGALVTTLLAGGPGEIVVGVILVAPVAAGLTLSALGLLLETLPESAPPGKPTAVDVG